MRKKSLGLLVQRSIQITGCHSHPRKSMRSSKLLRHCPKKCSRTRLLRTGELFQRPGPDLYMPIDKKHGRTNGYRINTASYYFTSFAFLPLLSAAKTVGNFPEPGNIVNLSSMSGITKTSQRGQFSYNANK